MEAINVTDILDKGIRLEDQILIGLGRLSRSIAVGVRIVQAARQELTGETEQAVLTRLEVFGNKLLEIVGTRPS